MTESLIPYDQLETEAAELIAHQNAGGKVKKMWSVSLGREITCCVDGEGNLTQQKCIDEHSSGRLLDNQY